MPTALLEGALLMGHSVGLGPSQLVACRETLGRILDRVRLLPHGPLFAPDIFAMAGRVDDRRVVVTVHTRRVDFGLHALALAQLPVGGLLVSVLPARDDVMATMARLFGPLNPEPLPPGPSFGLGDRIGIATPAHIDAMASRGVFPVLAQQSVREMGRTGRTPARVMAEAQYGCLCRGYGGGFGADADHLKTADEIREMMAAGFTLFTLDPSDLVVDEADAATPDQLRALAAGLAARGVDIDGVVLRHTDKSIDLGDGAPSGVLTITQTDALRAAVKYGAALAHAAALGGVVGSESRSEAQIELSLDETGTPTSLAEHAVAVLELERAGIAIDSLAPRFPGAWEKGIDFRGDVGGLEEEVRDHAALARRLGSYRLSVHSGSDKLSVYGAMARATCGALHVKTAGTSYLEAVRALCREEPALARRIIDVSRRVFDEARATYHISGRLDRVPPPDTLADDGLEEVYLDTDDGRQIVHVAYGHVIGTDADPALAHDTLAALDAHEGTYHELLEAHFVRHLDALTEGL